MYSSILQNLFPFGTSHFRLSATLSTFKISPLRGPSSPSHPSHLLHPASSSSQTTSLGFSISLESVRKQGMWPIEECMRIMQNHQVSLTLRRSSAFVFGLLHYSSF